MLYVGSKTLYTRSGDSNSGSTSDSLNERANFGIMWNKFLQEGVVDIYYYKHTVQLCVRKGTRKQEWFNQQLLILKSTHYVKIKFNTRTVLYVTIVVL